MRAFIDDNRFLRFLTQFVLLHMFALILGPLMLFLWLPPVLRTTIGDAKLTSHLRSEGEVIEVPLVDKDRFGYSSSIDKYYAFVDYKGTPVRHYSKVSLANEQTISIYDDPSLFQWGSSGDLESGRVVEASGGLSWADTYAAVAGRSVMLSLLHGGGLLLGGSFLTLSALLGFVRMRLRGPRRRRRR